MKKIRFKYSSVLLMASVCLFLFGCSNAKRQSDNPINVSHYKRNKENVFAYSPNLVQKLQQQIDEDNKYVREHREQMINFDKPI